MTSELFLEKRQDNNGKKFHILGVYKYTNAFGFKQVFSIIYQCRHKGKIEIQENDLNEMVMEIIISNEGLTVVFENDCFKNSAEITH